MAKTKVRIVEMGLRDGLQNEKVSVSVEDRLRLTTSLVAAGFRELEIGAFVSAKWVPQMAGTKELIQQILVAQGSKKLPQDLRLSALVPNEQGMRDAVAAGLPEVAVFTAASESFTKANINCTIEESFERFVPVLKMAKSRKIKVRGYLSCSFWCPFEGRIAPATVIPLALRLLEMGCYEVSIGDTIGAASPAEIEKLFTGLKAKAGLRKFAGHFHDTRGQALANLHAAFRLGVRTFDASVGGLGGCPYAPGAKGNVSTEDVLYSFQGMNVDTGLDLGALVPLRAHLETIVQHQVSSRVAQVGLPKGF